MTKALAIKLITVVVCFIAVFTVYILLIKLQLMTGIKIFYIVTAGLLIVTVILNGGFNKDIPKPEQLRDSWSDETKQKFINTLIFGKKWAKRLMYLLLPMLIAVMIDVVYLFWFSRFAK